MNEQKLSPKLKPLSADELERDAERIGVESDESVVGEGEDTHLPASEAELLKDEKSERPSPGKVVALPPD